jgi:integrase
MGITNDRGRYYWVKRVPSRFLGLVLGETGEPITQVRQALNTADRTEAKLKAAQIENERLAEWEALAAGNADNARLHYEAAQRLAQAKGYSYRLISDLAGNAPDELAARILDGGSDPRGSRAAAQALVGTVREAYPSLIQLRDDYFEMTKARHIEKSERQYHRWKLPRSRAVKNFIDVVAKKDAQGKPVLTSIEKITPDHALEFRAWWAARVVAEGMDLETPNKDFGHLAEMFSTWTKLKKKPLPNPFSGLRFDNRRNKNKTKHPPFSSEWMKVRLLAEGALAGMNDEERDIFLMMVNTGVRPSEITDAPISDFVLDHEIPFLRIAPHGRELKVVHTERDIPLLGVSLDAAKRIVERGGIARYAQNAGSWSAAANKFLRTNGLMETPKHVAYSVRHYVEDALLAAGVDDRIRADVLGHEYKRPSYGSGGALVGRRDALRQIAL